MRDVGKIVFNESHKERQSHHHRETGEEDESEVVFAPGVDPVRDKPAAKTEADAFLLPQWFACSWHERNLMYANYCDQCSHKEGDARKHVEEGGAVPYDIASRG